VGEEHQLGHRLDVVDDIVEGLRERVDVLTVERRDEGLFRRWRIVRVISSPWRSHSLIRSWPASEPSAITARRRRAHSAAFAAAWSKSGKNLSSVGSSRKRTEGG
jgi:hypothetical protein